MNLAEIVPWNLISDSIWIQLRRKVIQNLAFEPLDQSGFFVPDDIGEMNVKKNLF